MPRLGLGTSKLREASQVEIAIRSAGYRHLDSASFYENEEVVGEGLANCITSGAVQREDMFITTKMWHTEYENPEQALRQSLQKLRLEYVDMYLIHWPANGFSSPKVPMHVLWPKMEQLKEMGLTRAIGVSNFNTQLLADMLTYCQTKPAVN